MILRLDKIPNLEQFQQKITVENTPDVLREEDLRVEKYH